MNLKQLREAMAKTAQPAPVSVDVPGWGVVYVRPSTVGEVDEARTQAQDKNAIARGILRQLCDADGNRLPFTDEDVQAMAAQPWTQITAIRDAIDKATPGN